MDRRQGKRELSSDAEGNPSSLKQSRPLQSSSSSKSAVKMPCGKVVHTTKTRRQAKSSHIVFCGTCKKNKLGREERNVFSSLTLDRGHGVDADEAGEDEDGRGGIWGGIVLEENDILDTAGSATSAVIEGKGESVNVDINAGLDMGAGVGHEGGGEGGEGGWEDDSEEDMVEDDMEDMMEDDAGAGVQEGVDVRVEGVMETIYILDELKGAPSLGAAVEVVTVEQSLTPMDHTVLEMVGKNLISQKGFRVLASSLVEAGNKLRETLRGACMPTGDGLGMEEMPQLPPLLTLTSWDKVNARVAQMEAAFGLGSTLLHTPTLPDDLKTTVESTGSRVPTMAYTSLSTLARHTLQLEGVRNSLEEVFLARQPGSRWDANVADATFTGLADGLLMESLWSTIPEPFVTHSRTRIMPMTVFSDETHVFGTRDGKEHPVYVGVPTLPESIRTTAAGRQLAALLPSPYWGVGVSKQKKTKISSAVYLSCMNAVMETIRDDATRGFEVVTSDGIYYVFPRLVAFVGDTPERAKMLALRGGVKTHRFCGVCLLPAELRDRDVIQINPDTVLPCLASSPGSVGHLFEVVTTLSSQNSGRRQAATMVELWEAARLARAKTKEMKSLKESLKDLSIQNIPRHPILEGDNPFVSNPSSNLLHVTSCVDHLHVILLGVARYSLAFAVHHAVFCIVSPSNGTDTSFAIGDAYRDTWDSLVYQAGRYVINLINARAARVVDGVVLKTRVPSNVGNLLVRGTTFKGEEVRDILRLAPLLFDSECLFPNRAIRDDVVGLFLDLNEFCRHATAMCHDVDSVINFHNLAATIFNTSKSLFSSTREFTLGVRDPTTPAGTRRSSPLPLSPVAYPKMHSMLHFAEAVVWFGTCRTTNTATFELAHRFKIKQLARRFGYRRRRAVFWAEDAPTSTHIQAERRNRAHAVAREKASLAMMNGTMGDAALHLFDSVTSGTASGTARTSTETRTACEETVEETVEEAGTAEVVPHSVPYTASSSRSVSKERQRIAQALEYQMESGEHGGEISREASLVPFIPGTLAEMIAILRTRFKFLGLGAPPSAVQLANSIRDADDGRGGPGFLEGDVDPCRVSVKIHAYAVVEHGARVYAEPMVHNGGPPRFDAVVIESQPDDEVFTGLFCGHVRCIFSAWPRGESPDLGKTWMLVELLRIGDGNTRVPAEQLDELDHRGCLLLHAVRDEPRHSLIALTTQDTISAVTLALDIARIKEAPHVPTPPKEKRERITLASLDAVLDAEHPTTPPAPAIASAPAHARVPSDPPHLAVPCTFPPGMAIAAIRKRRNEKKGRKKRKRLSAVTSASSPSSSSSTSSTSSFTSSTVSSSSGLRSPSSSFVPSQEWRPSMPYPRTHSHAHSHSHSSSSDVDLDEPSESSNIIPYVITPWFD